jgi:type VI protein secretion system component VasK
VGSSFSEKTHASLAINPEALQFLRGLAAISSAMYPSGAALELQWQVAPADLTRGANKPTRVRMKFGSGPDRLYGDEKSVNTWNSVIWRPAQDQSIEFTDVVGPGVPRGLSKTWSGPWAPMEFFGGAGNWKPNGPDTYSFTVDLGSRVSLPMKAIMTASVRSVVQGTIFRGLECPGTWVRRK